MPYINVNVSVELDQAKKDAVKAELGRLIDILPGKSESVLMIELNGSKTMYFRGEQKPPCAFVEVRLYKESPMDAKKEFTAKVFEMLERLLGLKPEDVFLNILEMQNWGVGGSLK
jgi:phenylpyruvate tautomerase PptA (4-oxalocrotonate tautomerase family)